MTRPIEIESTPPCCHGQRFSYVLLARVLEIAGRLLGMGAAASPGLSFRRSVATARDTPYFLVRRDRVIRWCVSSVTSRRIYSFTPVHVTSLPLRGRQRSQRIYDLYLPASPSRIHQTLLVVAPSASRHGLRLSVDCLTIIRT